MREGEEGERKTVTDTERDTQRNQAGTEPDYKPQGPFPSVTHLFQEGHTSQMFDNFLKLLHQLGSKSPNT